MNKNIGFFILRTVAAIAFLIIAVATYLSLDFNHERQWFDWVAAAPLIYILVSLAIFRNDSALVEELDTTLIRIRRCFLRALRADR